MRIFLAERDDGSVRILGGLAPPDHGRISVVFPKGHSLFGLPYEEAIQYEWIETNDDGHFISGEKRRPRVPLSPNEPPPPFLRKHPR